VVPSRRAKMAIIVLAIIGIILYYVLKDK